VRRWLLGLRSSRNDLDGRSEAIDRTDLVDRSDPVDGDRYRL
jgi:hypothetical protein